jgi:hydrogenase small subunit
MSPFYDRLPAVPGFGVEASAGAIGAGLVGAVAIGVTAHGLINMIKPAPKPPVTPVEPNLERGA